MADLLTYLLGGDFFILLFFLASLAILFGVERKRSAGQLGAWVPGRPLVMGLFFWTLGMVFDSFRRGFGMEDMRFFENLFEFAGNVLIAYSAYGAYKQMGAYSLGKKGAVQ